MENQGVDSGTLGTAKDRVAFRTAHHDFVYQAAMGVSGSCQEAEKLTEELFKMMEERFRTERLPFGVEMYMLSRLHMLYAKGTKPTEGLSPVPAAPAAQVEAPARKAAAAPAAEPGERKGHGPSTAAASAAAAAFVQPIAPVTAPASHTAPAAHATAASAVSAVQAAPYAAAYAPQAAPQEAPAGTAVQAFPLAGMAVQGGMQPMVIQLPGGAQSYFAPQPYLVQPLYPVQGAPANMAQAPTPEELEAAAAQAPVEAAAVPSPAAAEEMSYDPTLTEFWSPAMERAQQQTEPANDTAEKQEAAQRHRRTAQPKPAEPMMQAAPQPKPAEPETKVIMQPVPTAPAPQPKPQAPTVPKAIAVPDSAAEKKREQEEARMQRSVPLTIINTFLFLGMLTAIAYLLMEIGLLPKLF